MHPGRVKDRTQSQLDKEMRNSSLGKDSAWVGKEARLKQVNRWNKDLFSKWGSRQLTQETTESQVK